MGNTATLNKRCTYCRGKQVRIVALHPLKLNLESSPRFFTTNYFLQFVILFLLHQCVPVRPSKSWLPNLQLSQRQKPLSRIMEPQGHKIAALYLHITHPAQPLIANGPNILRTRFNAQASWNPTLGCLGLGCLGGLRILGELGNSHLGRIGHYCRAGPGKSWQGSGAGLRGSAQGLGSGAGLAGCRGPHSR